MSFSDFTYCMKLKSKPPAEAEQSLRERFPSGSKHQYPAGHVWEFRDNGGEDSEQSRAPFSRGSGPASSTAASVSSPVDSASPAAPTTATTRPFVSAASLATASTPSAAMRHLAACRSCEAMLTPV